MNVCSQLLRCAACLLLLFLASCSQGELLQKFSTREDQALAGHYVELPQARNFDAIEQALDPSVDRATARDKLPKMADLVPVGEPTSVRLVGASRNCLNRCRVENGAGWCPSCSVSAS